ncbi:TM2 domain-containing protein [Oscillatoria amoena NRMC-F 0135]|nr:TM2 domain-containing protein [Oscillatoria amoena NRMC-F 0135]
MAKIVEILPELTGEEMVYVQNLIKDWDDEKARSFASVYRTRRREPQMILIVTIVGLLGIAGIQRFITDQIGMGLLYFFTLGLCYIGTIIDLVNYQKIAFEYNQKMANEVATMTR